ncbi:MAG: BlaI/MecI/CopY family transcriptional regulator [Lachnospiraceae bacterium]|nr:BlaI/MecI/CopY family transcriptional regulator [Lachnospiraceae bacterium]
MEHEKLFEGEYRFMQLIWDKAPVNSGELVKMCETAFEWKKSTTYTMIKKLCEKGYIANKDAMITVLIGRDTAQTEVSRDFVDRTFSGSIFDMFTAFYGGEKISEEEAKKLIDLIDMHREGK